MVPLPLWSPRCAIAALMVCRCGPRATTAPMVCHHGPHAISSPPLCHGGARGAVPPTPTARCPRCAQSLCRVLCCPPPAPHTAWGHRGPPQGWDGDTRGVGMAATAPPSAWGQGATRPYSAGADTPVGFLWGGRGAGYRTPFCAPPPSPGSSAGSGRGRRERLWQTAAGQSRCRGGRGTGGSVPCSGGGGGVGGGVFAPGCPHLIAEGGDAARCPPHCGPHG